MPTAPGRMSEPDKIALYFLRAEGVDWRRERLAAGRLRVVVCDASAYVNFLTLAGDEAEYRSKVASALAYYRLELHGFENVRLFTLSDNPAEELIFHRR